MKQSSGPLTFNLDASNLGEIRAAMEAVKDLPDDTFATFTAAIEIVWDQAGSRALAVNVYPGKTDERPAQMPTLNRAQRRKRGMK